MQIPFFKLRILLHLNGCFILSMLFSVKISLNDLVLMYLCIHRRHIVYIRGNDKPLLEMIPKRFSRCIKIVSPVLLLYCPFLICRRFYFGLYLGFPEQDLYYTMALGTYDRKEILLAHCHNYRI